MSVAGTIDAPLDLFGGLVTDMAAADLPPGVSPDCGDVAFLQGGVKTRPGLVSVYAPIAGNPTVNYLKTFTQPDLVKTLLAIDSAGTLWGENSPGVLTQIAAGLMPNAAANSASIFAREYIAQHDGNFGLDIPRQYDGTNLDRVSQVGPGAGPTLVGDVVANISAISRTSERGDRDHRYADGNAGHGSGDHRGRDGLDLQRNVSDRVDYRLAAFHLRADGCQFVLQRRDGRAGGIDQRGRAPVLGDFCNAARILDAAIAADFLDLYWRMPCDGDWNSVGGRAAQCGGAHSRVHRSGRRFVLLHDGLERLAADASV